MGGADDVMRSRSATARVWEFCDGVHGVDRFEVIPLEAPGAWAMDARMLGELTDGWMCLLCLLWLYGQNSGACWGPLMLPRLGTRSRLAAWGTFQ